MTVTIDDLKERELPIIKQNRKAAEFVTRAELAEVVEGMKRYTRHWVRDHGDSA